MRHNSAEQTKSIDSHSSNPIVENLFGIQFRSVKLPGIGHMRADDEADNCLFLKDMSVVAIVDFVKGSKNMGVVVGKKYESQGDAYKYPCQSSVKCVSILYHPLLFSNRGT